MKSTLRTVAAGLLATASLLTTTHAVDTAPLYSILKQGYQISVMGRVVSVDPLPEDTRVYFEVRPLGSKPIEVSAPVREDGVFSLEVSMQNFRNDLVDWTLRAENTTSSSILEEGRQILSEESVIVLERSIDLNDKAVVLALR